MAPRHLNNKGAPFGFRSGNWRLPPNGGGEDSSQPAPYNLADDLGETTNVARSHPEIVAAMTARLAGITGKSPTTGKPNKKLKRMKE